jgi:hypothetical protein
MKRWRSYAAVLQSIGPVVICLAAILLTTLVLLAIDSYLPTEHLMLGYLLPTIFVAIYFGSTIAVLTSVAELGFTVMLAVIASKVVGVLAYDIRRQAADGRADEVVE